MHVCMHVRVCVRDLLGPWNLRSRERGGRHSPHWQTYILVRRIIGTFVWLCDENNSRLTLRPGWQPVPRPGLCAPACDRRESQPGIKWATGYVPRLYHDALHETALSEQETAPQTRTSDACTCAINACKVLRSGGECVARTWRLNGSRLR